MQTWGTSNLNSNNIWADHVKPKLEKAYYQFEDFALGRSDYDYEYDSITYSENIDTESMYTNRFNYNGMNKIGIPLCTAPLGRGLRHMGSKEGGGSNADSRGGESLWDEDTLAYAFKKLHTKDPMSPESSRGAPSTISGLTSVTFGSMNNESWSYVEDGRGPYDSDDERKRMNAEYRDSPPKTGNAGFEVSIPATQMKRLLHRKVREDPTPVFTFNNTSRVRGDPSKLSRNNTRNDVSEILQYARITEALSNDPMYFPNTLDRTPKQKSSTFRELKQNAATVDCNKLAKNDGLNRKVTWGIPRVFTSRDECDADGRNVDGVLVLPPGSAQPIYLVANMDEKTSPSKLAAALTDVLLAHSRPERERKAELKELVQPKKSNLRTKLTIDKNIQIQTKNAPQLFSPIATDILQKQSKELPISPALKTPRTSNTSKNGERHEPTKTKPEPQNKNSKSKRSIKSIQKRSESKAGKSFFSFLNSKKTKQSSKDTDIVKVARKAKNPYATLNTPDKKSKHLLAKKISKESNPSRASKTSNKRGTSISKEKPQDKTRRKMISGKANAGDEDRPIINLNI